MRLILLFDITGDYNELYKISVLGGTYAGDYSGCWNGQAIKRVNK